MGPPKKGSPDGEPPKTGREEYGVEDEVIPDIREEVAPCRCLEVLGF